MPGRWASDHVTGGVSVLPNLFSTVRFQALHDFISFLPAKYIELIANQGRT
jgi:hypothetical protein